ncbi:MAG: hypothetical protein OD815_000334 [Candidatus Alkanophagales archaeon MCA70_species_2]|nr:hypothetical protein [Candidatus Alkanophaga liquidiphilum]
MEITKTIKCKLIGLTKRKLELLIKNTIIFNTT